MGRDHPRRDARLRPAPDAHARHRPDRGALPHLARRAPERPSQVSFAAWGREAEAITSGHRLENSLGEGSPLARLYERDAQVLLIGAGYDSCTSFHLAEYRTGNAQPARLGAPIMENGRRTWVWFEDIDLRADVFDELGRDFERDRPVARGPAGSAEARLFSQRAAVDYAVDWLRAHGR